MKPNLKTLVIMLVLATAACAAYAETVQISTYYPSPYGVYQTLDTTGNTTLANAGGAVAVGTATVPPAGVKLDVQGGYVRTQDTAVGGATFAFMQRSGTTSNFGSIDGAAATFGNSEGGLTADANRVGVGTTPVAAAAYRMDVAAPPADAAVGSPALNVNGTIRVRDAAGRSGILQVDCDNGTPGVCYPVYA